MGSIGEDAKQGWLDNPHMVPEGSQVFAAMAKTKEQQKIKEEPKKEGHMILRNIFLVVLLSCFYSNLYAVCTTETVGLCTPGTTSETSGSEVTDTIVTNQDSGDLF